MAKIWGLILAAFAQVPCAAVRPENTRYYVARNAVMIMEHNASSAMEVDLAQTLSDEARSLKEEPRQGQEASAKNPTEFQFPEACPENAALWRDSEEEKYAGIQWPELATGSRGQPQFCPDGFTPFGIKQPQPSCGNPQVEPTAVMCCCEEANIVKSDMPGSKCKVKAGTGAGKCASENFMNMKEAAAAKMAAAERAVAKEAAQRKADCPRKACEGESVKKQCSSPKTHFQLFVSTCKDADWCAPAGGSIRKAFCSGSRCLQQADFNCAPLTETQIDDCDYVQQKGNRESMGKVHVCKISPDQSRSLCKVCH